MAEIWDELEKLGEDEVRVRYASGRIYGSDKRPLVEEWLRRKDESRSDASQAEQIEIARSAKDAAWAAAEAARDAASTADEAAEVTRQQSLIAKAANTRATIALVIATISAAVLIIDVILKLSE